MLIAMPGLQCPSLLWKAPAHSVFFWPPQEMVVWTSKTSWPWWQTPDSSSALWVSSGEPRALRMRARAGHPEVSDGNGSHHPMSPEQNALMDMAPPNPHTLFFEILSLLVEMLALPEGALEEITRWVGPVFVAGGLWTRKQHLAFWQRRILDS